MTIDTRQLIDDILKEINDFDYLQPENIPDLDLYVDQVTTLINNHFPPAKKLNNDRQLTKTMVNNYAKNHLLPPPNKKKYTKDHIILLVFINYFKNIISFHDIQKVLDPITQRCFGSDQQLSLEKLFRTIFDQRPAMQKALAEYMEQKLDQAENLTKTLCQDVPEYKDLLEIFTLICTLSIDIYIKKVIIEQLIQTMYDAEHTP